MKTTGERIRQARDALGWSAHVLALKVGYKTQSGISNLENRPTGSGGNKIGEIAKSLGVPLDWLINGPDSDKVPFNHLEAPAVETAVASENVRIYHPQPSREDALKVELLELFSKLDYQGKVNLLNSVRFFVDALRPHQDGAASAMAGQKQAGAPGA